MIDSVIIRRRDAGKTRGAILAAAQVAFATRGYGQVGLRQIAAEAGADPALVRRYFGSKEGLFEAALDDALDINMLLDTPRCQFGVHLATLLIDGYDGANPLPIMMMAMADPAVRPIALDLLHCRVITPLAQWIGGCDADQRAARVSMLCSGFISYVRLLPLKIFDTGIDSGTRNWLEGALQAAIDY
jgi:AcrR family transcriptional regulator